jgi:hypothetical protein
MLRGALSRLAAILLTFLLPLILTSLLPFYIFRWTALQLARLRFSNQIRTLLTARSSFYAIDDLYTLPKYGIISGTTVEGALRISELRDIFCSRVLYAHMPNNRNNNGEHILRYPELQEYEFPWLGYIFWRKESNFKMEDHISLHPNVLHSDEEVFQFGNSLVSSPFERAKSPWKLILVHSDRNNNPNEVFSTIFLKIHHSLGDGMSVLKVLNFLSDGNNFIVAKPSSRGELGQSGRMLAFWRGATTLVCAPYQLFVHSFQPNPSNPWQLKEGAGPKIMGSSSSAFLKIPIQNIKDIKNMNKTSFAGVLLAAIAGSIRTAMLENGNVDPMLDSIQATIPLPVPGHPSKLRNFL